MLRGESLIAVILISMLSSCYVVHKSSGGGERVNADNKREINPDDIAVPDGYLVEVAATGLTFPTGIAFDDEGTAYVTEAGYSYGEVFREPALVRINNDGTTEKIAIGSKNGPWNGVTFHNGDFYVSEGGQLEGGKILKINKKGNISIVLEGLPSFGDHHTNGPAINKGYIYFGQGTATNSSVVGEDNYKFGWLKRKPEFHDIPCRDIKLTGKNFTSPNVLKEGTVEKATTGAFMPFGTASGEGQVIPGQIPCTGAIMRIPLGGGKPEIVAWGLRNPYGLSFDAGNQLYISENGFDDRGSRPVWGTGDYLWKIEQGRWYGWPDYAGGHSLAEGNLSVPGKGKPYKILAEDPEKPPRPVASLGVHSSSNGFDFSRSDVFGFRGEAFIAQFGDMSPDVGKVYKPVGFKVVRVNTETGSIHDFALNKKKNAPASKLKTGGIERPTAARFTPDGKYLYIVDFGIMLTSKKGPTPLENTGVVWKVSKKAEQ